MKKLLLFVAIVPFLASCSNTSLKGKYLKVSDNDRGSITNFLDLSLIEEVDFGIEMCRFEYFGIPMSGNYKIDDNYVYIEVGGELGTLSMEIINKETLEGEGWISGTFKKQ
jgi:hypothetical protein